MRRAIYVAAALALALCDPLTGRTLLAGAASALLEAMPYLTAAAILARFAGGRAAALLPYLGCGCDRGFGARSMPAALATALLFGPWVAITRVGAATVFARLRPRQEAHEHHESILAGLVALAPAAAVAALVSVVLPALHLAAVPAFAQIVCGVALGFAAAPCALGGVVLAAALRTQAPLAATAFLCVAGIVDLRCWFSPRLRHLNDDALAYGALAVTATLVAWQHGAALVHPRVAFAIGAAAPILAALAWRRRNERGAQARWIPAVMLGAIVIGAPAPHYSATETTLADAFPGERLDFTGMLVRAHGTASLVRFAITCCRADAQPVAVVLSDAPRSTRSQWFRAIGVIEKRDSMFRLVPERLTPIAAPYDPFIYR